MGNSREADEKIKVKKRVKETEREIWEAGMQTKSALEIYRSFKKDIAKEPIFDNSRGAPCCPRRGRECCGLRHIELDIRK